MKNPLLDEVRISFAQEIEAGRLTVDSANYRPETFGNADVVLSSSVFRLRLTVERGEPYAFLAPMAAPDRWVWLQLAVQAAGMPETCNSARPAPMQIDVNGAAELLRQNLSQLSAAFGVGWKATSHVLDELELKYREQMMRWLGSKEAAEDMSELNESAENALREPSEALKEAMKQLGLDE